MRTICSSIFHYRSFKDRHHLSRALVLASILLTSAVTHSFAAIATADANVFFGDVVGPAAHNEQENKGVGAAASDGAVGASASASASVDLVAITNVTDSATHLVYTAQIPRLHAKVTGVSNADHTVGGQGNAEATFRDNLRYGNPALVDRPSSSLILTSTLCSIWTEPSAIPPAAAF